MASLNKDLNRLIKGVTLVAKEFIKRSPTLDSAKSGGHLESLIASSLKTALISATDLTGLTKGNVREFSDANSNSSSSSSSSSLLAHTATDSVVYFNGPPNQASPDTTNSEVLDRNASNANVFVNEDQYPEKNLRQVYSGDSIGEADFSRPEIPTDETDGIVGKVEVRSPGQNVVSGDAGASGELTKTPPLKRRKPRERRVPSTPFSRALGFAALGGGLALGTLQESAKRLVFGRPSSPANQSALSPYLSEKNAERIALALCRMRGAALKVGQMLSIQDESLVPAPILAALDIVRHGADVMPRSQVNKVLDSELGPDWTSKLTSFDYEPLAAASIGQVHRAVTKDGMQVAMKIQYPGVADSIDSDIRNVKLLLDYTNLIPEGLYLDQAIKVAREELARECDYELEAAKQKRFRDLLSGIEGLYVPIVVDEISSKRVLTTELVLGIPIDKVAQLEQETRNVVGKKLMELTLMELFVFRFMQTDPNWSNFLFNETTEIINLIDFGAARDYPKSFVDDYIRMVIACSNGDRDEVIEMSKRLGFLTGSESEIMLDAHVQSGFVVGLPFAKPGGYDFRNTDIIKSITSLGATMLKHRLTPPPDEAYSLHRKLAGAFLACIKLGAVVPCRELLLEVYENYQFGEEETSVLSSSLMSS